MLYHGSIERINLIYSKIRKKKDSKNNWNKYTSDINKGYNLALNAFEKKELIDYIELNAQIFPRLIGYNYVNDPELFIIFKEKNSTEWDYRSPTPITLLDAVEFVKKEYEFKDKNIEKVVKSFFN